MSDDRFEGDLKEVLLRGVPRSAPPALRVRVASVSGVEPRRRRVAVRLALVAVLVALVSGAILVPVTLHSGSDRYGDGIPRTWQGQPVLRGQAALDFAKASTDDTPFLIAFWAGIEYVHGCSAEPLGGNMEFGCRGMDEVGDQPGVFSNELGAALRVDTSKVAPGPVIARVHTHDPALNGCIPDYVAACQAVMVGDAILWSGDEATAPRPATVKQVAAAFGFDGPTYHWDMAGDFPGVAQVPFPTTSEASHGEYEGVAVVFPSTAALAAAYPEVVATGETDAMPSNSSLKGTISFGGSDPIRGRGTYTFNMYWLAQGNVLVGVEYDVSLGPKADPYVAMARADLAKLRTGMTVEPVATATPSSSQPPSAGYVGGIAFFDDLHGLMVGGSEGSTYVSVTGETDVTGPEGNAVVWKTDDGGHTWAVHAVDAPPFVSISVVGSSYAIAGAVCNAHKHGPNCQDGLYASSDGGLTWNRLAAPYSMISLSMVDANDGWGVDWTLVPGGPGLVLRSTTEGGIPWLASATSPCPNYLSPISVSFASTNLGWVACEGVGVQGLGTKAISKTVDGGRTWQLQAAVDATSSTPGLTTLGSIPGEDYQSGLAMDSSGKGLVWEKLGGVIGTGDGGRTWQSIVPAGAKWTSALAGFVAASGTWTLALMDEPNRRQVLEQSTDDGQTWHQLAVLPLP
jgi:photosystem II stability/assembly factor-like uncharacterized protein